MRQILFFIFAGLFLFHSGKLRAQITEDFSDGDFSSNPSWIGMTDSFLVSSGQLRSTVGTSNQSVNLFLATASTQNFYSWEFYFRLAFNPSSQNYAEFWLSTDNLDIGQAQNGYFVRLGGNTNDGIGLYKKQNGVETPIIDGTGNTLVNGTSNNFGSIRVSRTLAGNWQIFEKITSANFLPFGSGSDNSLSNSLGIGVYIQTTKTNRSKHYFDDIQAELLPAADTIAPNLNALLVSPPKQVDLVFSEDVDSLFAADLAHYSMIPAQSILSATRLVTDRRKVRIMLADTFAIGTNTLQVFSSKDLAGNIQLDSQAQSFSYIPATPAPWRSVVINEIYADETPSLGLPGGEFLELFNRGNSDVSLGGWSISDAGNPVVLPEITLPAGGHLVLCANADTAAFAPFGKTLGISLPSLNNSGDSLKLRDAFGNLVDEVNYVLSWYQDPSKSSGGYSLEQINPLLKCSGKSNWIASNAGIGGTPAQANSVLSLLPDTLPPVLDSLKIENANALRISFSEPVNFQDFTLASFGLSNGATVSGLTILDERRLRLDLNSGLVAGQSYLLTCLGAKDCEGNQIDTLRQTFLFLPPQPIAYRKLQINEIYADESPSLGLPLREYLEIFNPSSSPIQLEGVRLVVGSTQVILPEYKLNAGAYLTLCDNDSLNRFLEFGPALGINLPTLNNSGFEIRLLDKAGDEIDKIMYSLDLFDDASKKDGGYSLEQVNPDRICSSKSNWRASLEGLGGTPGQANSVLAQLPDSEAPSLLSTELLSNSSVRLQFNEPVNEVPPALSDLEILGGNSILSIQNRYPDIESITLNFSNGFTAGVLFTLKLNNTKDCAGNTAGLLEIPIGIGRSPEKFDLLITEIQADDTPENSLPKAEYVEIFNNSSTLLDLAGLKLSDASSTAALPTGLLAPGDYLVLCGTSSVGKFSVLPSVKARGITSFPSINLEGDNLLLTGPGGKFIHRFYFRSSDFAPYSSWEKGWSLEMIDTGNPCSEKSNWAISSAAEGGTPGKENSVKATKPDLEPPHLLRLSLPDSNSIRITWNEIIDSASMASASINLSGGFSINERIILGPDFSGLTIVLNQPLPRNTPVTVTVSQTSDCAGNISIPESLTVARPNSPQPGSWIINEILFDPLTGGTDYVELRNLSTGYLDLMDIQVGNGSDVGDISTESLLLEPGAFALLTKSSALTLRDYPRGKSERFVETVLPTFGLDTGTVRILDKTGRELERFSYSADFHAPVLDDVKGVSLERISSGLSSNLSDSWQSASADAGFGTPGYENSNDRDFDISGGFKAEPKVFTPNGDGKADFTFLSYESAETNVFANLRIYSSTGLLVKNLAQSANLGSKGFWKWDGRNEVGRKASMGLYLAVLELNEQGKQSRYLRIPLAITEDR